MPVQRDPTMDTRVTRRGVVLDKDQHPAGVFWLNIQWEDGRRSFIRVAPAQWAQASRGAEVERHEEIRRVKR